MSSEKNTKTILESEGFKIVRVPGGYRVEKPEAARPLTLGDLRTLSQLFFKAWKTERDDDPNEREKDAKLQNLWD